MDDFLQILFKSYYTQIDREQDRQTGMTEARVALRKNNTQRDYGLKSTRCNCQSVEEEVIKRAMTDMCGLLLGATSVRSPYDREEALCEQRFLLIGAAGERTRAYVCVCEQAYAHV